MTSRYKLITPGGTYYADSLLVLFFEVIKHRFWHLVRHGRWMD